MSNLEIFRNSFDRSAAFIHLNNAGVAPMSKPAAQAVTDTLARLVSEGYHCVPELWAQVEATRQKLARLLNSEADEIAFFQSAAAAISQVALGLDLKQGDEILTWDQEYPSNFYPWRAAVEKTGANLVIAASGPALDSPLESLFAAVTPRTRVIAVSWVQFRTGAIVDLKGLSDFARARGIFTCVDIIQGAGFLPFDFKDLGIDAACGGSHKWFTAGPTVGYLILRGEHLERIKPILYGAITYGSQNDPSSMTSPFKAGAQRYEPGSKTFLDIASFDASIDLVAKVGVAQIGQEIEWLSRKLRHGLEERGYKVHSPHGRHHRGSIVNFGLGPDCKFKSQADVVSVLKQNKISFGERPPGVRLSPHAFNTAAEIETVLQLL
jgi:cysteine desulfurase/selenocysteine lyase